MGQKEPQVRFFFALCRGLIYHSAKSFERGLVNDEE
jgi:hypothetical protein